MIENGSQESPKQESPKDEELELFRQLRKGKDKDLRERLIHENLQIVVPIAKKFVYNNNKESLEDLIQVGYIGLIKAVDQFDPDRGVKFITYATHCIMGEIRHYLRDKSESIKRPRWLTRLNREIARYIEEFLQENKRLPSITEISTALNIEGDGIVEILKAKYMVSVDDLNEGSTDYLMLNRIRSRTMENFKLPIEDKIALEQAMESLKKLEKIIIKLFFYMDLTQSQIAVNLGLSQKKVSRLLKKSIDKMREAIVPKKSIM